MQGTSPRVAGAAARLVGRVVGEWWHQAAGRGCLPACAVAQQALAAEYHASALQQHSWQRETAVAKAHRRQRATCSHCRNSSWGSQHHSCTPSVLLLQPWHVAFDSRYWQENLCHGLYRRCQHNICSSSYGGQPTGSSNSNTGAPGSYWGQPTSSSKSSAGPGSNPHPHLHGVHPGQEPHTEHSQRWGSFQPGHVSSDDGSSSGNSQGGSSSDANPNAFSRGGNEEDYMAYFPEDYESTGLRLRFRRKTPTFQVIEFHSNGVAVEEYRPRSPQELGLHPRDVTLFAPLSRLAAPQRATIAVHDGKILVKTEIVKAIITADKAILIKGRRQQHTQRVASAILAANDQRLLALKLHQHQQEQISYIVPGTLKTDSTTVRDSCERAASAADLIIAATQRSGGASHRGSSSSLPRSSARLTVRSAGSNAGFSSSSTGRTAEGRFIYKSRFRVTPVGESDGASNRQYAAGVDYGGEHWTPAGVAAGQDALAKAGGNELKDVAWEMLVLEVLLDATAEYFYNKVQHLNWMLESIAADIRQPSQPQTAMDKAHQLMPIQKFLTSVKNDVKETTEAIKAVLADDDTLDDLCLSYHVQQRKHTPWQPVELQPHKANRGDINGNGSNSTVRSGRQSYATSQQVRMLTEMLESYEREIQSLEGSINEAEEDLENTRSIWHMQLDSSRNHIIMVNLWLSMLNISVMATTILPAFFGMNLSSGLAETNPINFYAVCGCSLLLAAVSYPLSRYWYTRNWRRINQTEAFEQKMLRVLLVQNIDDLDMIVDKLRKMDRSTKMDKEQFKWMVHDTLGERAMTPAHIDFLFHCFDRNHDGFLEMAERISRPYRTQINADMDNDYTISSKAGLVPPQLGSLAGANGKLHQDAESDDDSVLKSIRLTPRQRLEYVKQRRQQQQQGKGQDQKPKDYPGDWMDDERFTWD